MSENRNHGWKRGYYRLKGQDSKKLWERQKWLLTSLPRYPCTFPRTFSDWISAESYFKIHKKWFISISHKLWAITEFLNLSLVPDEDPPNWSVHKYCFDLATLDMKDNFANHKKLQKSTWIWYATKWMLFWRIKNLSKPKQYSSRAHEHSWIYIDTHHRHLAEANNLLW